MEKKESQSEPNKKKKKHFIDEESDLSSTVSLLWRKLITDIRSRMKAL